MISQSYLQKIKIFWIDTGYLPPETYHYAEKLINDLSLEVEVLQSELSLQEWRLYTENFGRQIKPVI